MASMSNSRDFHPRDYQRQKVYDAESKVSEFTYNAIHDKLPTVEWEYLQKYVLEMTQKPWFQARYPRQTIRVKDGRRCRRAHGGYGTIWMPKWSRSPMIILHEIAHAVSYMAADKHGPTYCGHYLYLVYNQLGVKAYDELRASFIKYGVDFNDPIKRVEPSVVKEELIEKMRTKKRVVNPAAIEALRKYREEKKVLQTA
jgi:putative metallohydrolase (TIGR04338 family)